MLFVAFQLCVSTCYSQSKQQAGDIQATTEAAETLVRKRCIHCHDEATASGGLNLEKSLNDLAYQELIFENVISGKMPPAQDADPLGRQEKQLLLNFLQSSEPHAPVQTRNLAAAEFNYVVNDVLGISQDVSDILHGSSGSHTFDTNGHQKITTEHALAYFRAAARVTEAAFPPDNAFPQSQVWKLNEIYKPKQLGQYLVLDDDRGIAFGAARQKNGRDFPLFYKGFVAPVDGAYNVGFDGNHLTDRLDHTAVTILSGPLFQTVARGLPVRYHGVVSVSGKEPKRYSKTVHLTAGEYLAVHAYSSKTINKKPKKLGVVINKMQVEGPVLNSWPPPAYRKLMPDAKFTTAETPASGPESATAPARASATQLNYKTLQLSTPTKQALTKALRLVQRRTTGHQKADFKTAVKTFQRDGDFFGALRLGLLGLFTSQDFLVVSNQLNDVQEQRKFLARSIWRSVPDEELLSIKELSDRTLDQQIERMLNDPKSDRMIRALCDQWLELKNFDASTPSIELHPMYNQTLHDDLPQEAFFFLKHMVANDMRANHFIDSDFTFLNQRIALHYGMSDVHGHHFRKVSLPDDSLRGGLMTMASLLKVTSSGQQTSPIVRGAWISERIVGNHLSPPPAGVEAISPDLSDAKSIKEEIAAHKANESCYACHKSIDPYGLALEVFDSAGRERTHYRVPKIRNPKGFAYLWSAKGFYKQTILVDASGEISEGEFDDIRGLKTLLNKKSHSVVYHFSKTFYEYVTGASPSLNTRMKLWALGDCGVRTAIKEVLKLSIKERTK